MNAAGSLHLAYHEDEAQVLREYAGAFGSRRRTGRDARFGRHHSAQQRGKARGTSGRTLECSRKRVLTLGPSSPGCLTGWSRQHGVSLHFGTAVTDIDIPDVRAGGKSWQAERVWVCSGQDFETLFPEQLAASGMVRCKLQMMRTGRSAAAGGSVPCWRRA